MSFAINPALLAEDPATTEDKVGEEPRPKLPNGVYLEDDPIPDSRVELFRVNGRRYTLPKKVNPRITFRFMRAIRQASDDELAEFRLVTEMMYEILGEAVMDALADEELSEEELSQVQTAIQKYAMGGARAAGLGK